ncbi:Cleavage stimulation factor subunit 77 [Asimina triloba]
MIKKSVKTKSKQAEILNLLNGGKSFPLRINGADFTREKSFPHETDNYRWADDRLGYGVSLPPFSKTLTDRRARLQSTHRCSPPYEEKSFSLKHGTAHANQRLQFVLFRWRRRLPIYAGDLLLSGGAQFQREFILLGLPQIQAHLVYALADDYCVFTLRSHLELGGKYGKPSSVDVVFSRYRNVEHLGDVVVVEKTAREILSTDKYNVEAAEILANEAQLVPISEAAPIYEQLISTFPTAAKFWKQYVEAYMTVNNDDATKQIFSRRCYIRFIRKVNEKKGAEGLEETRKAFDFMLHYVGTDISSGPVWMEYIAFLKSLPAMTAQEESQRMTSVRKAYQRAIITPTHHSEQLWKDYENFENSVSRALAKGLLSEYQPKYNSARAVYREQKKYVDEIDWNMLAVPPTGSCKVIRLGIGRRTFYYWWELVGNANVIQEEQQYIAWKKFLAFEKGNPQRIDIASSNRRIAFAYEQCLLYLYHYPDIWYDYATWQAKSGSVEAAVKIFQRALKALPDSELLRYAFAELEESRGSIQPAKKIYENLLANDVNATALAHIQFIRFLRRTEGIEAARKYFVDARKSPNCTYHVYVAYAMMAFCLDKDPKLAHNVFESGLKKFMHEPGYILEYADFLCRLNDDRNVRALFERALSLLPPEESVEVWKRFTQFEQTYGDLASMLKVEQRRKEALSRTGEDGLSTLEGSLHDVVSRYSFMDLWPCSAKDLDHLARQEHRRR